MATETITIEVKDSSGTVLGSMDIAVSTDTTIDIETSGNS